ncbi:beta-lactamase [Hirsutella rhossiliensis]|uniref:Beta-lactamase domain-containing protein n=1 Tax=Hirsutella rhossiliensis TaxID=111463 RepID=A0A9P8MTK9_9HYPO|nr:beta-lactamase domain-containing protein [Hirsutella rhossiliensis]KAH0961793.1 beta-lactamase domain-containing protein [Hirsutella rhossiliensis]
MDLFRNPDFSAYVKKLIDRNHVPGIAIAVVQGQDVDSFAFGKASLETSQAFTPETLFCVGSAAKSLTAAAVALLVADNENYPQVQFTSTMASLLPDDFVMPGEDHADVTVEDVLSHRTGMAPHEYSIMGPSAKQPDNARSITRNLRNLTCVTKNRAEHVYCNMMYTVATHLVEHVSGMSFGDFLQKHIFAPLKMDSTCLLQDSVWARGLGHRLASGYSWDRPGQKYKMIQCNDGPESQGAGQIYATVDDYLKWVKAMLNREGPITDEIFNELTTKRIQQDPADNREQESCAFYALGWQVHEYGGHKIVSHDGGEPGYQCNHFFIPDLKFGGVIFSNSDQADTIVSLLMYKLIDELVHARLNGKVQYEDESDSESESVSGSGSEDEEHDDDMEEELRQELSPGLGEPEPQKLPLGAYTGRYQHPGYHGIEVEDKDGALFVDGTDRSYGFTLTMKHICNQNKYIAYVSQAFEDSEIPIKVEFRLDNNRAVAIGIHLEERMDEYIWFDRLEG